MKFFNVGKIVNTHGVRGEVKVVSASDFPELRFRKGNVLTAFSPDGVLRRTLEISDVRIHKNMYLLKFTEVESMTSAEQLKQWTLKIDETAQQSLPDGEYYFHQIIGCEVITDEGQNLGAVTSILTPGANHVWVVTTTAKKEVLLPVIDDVILNVDIQKKQITVHILEGLI